MVYKSPRSLALRLRASLAPALAFLLLNSTLAALAQGPVQIDGTAAPRTKSSPYVAAPSSGFIVYQDENGNAVCRVATPAEANSMGRGRDVELRQINHLRESGVLGASSTQEADAAGLTIILRATAQLDANPAAKAAFTAAAARWEALIQDAITVVIDVDYGTTAFGTPFNNDNVLAQTGSQGLYFDNNYSDVRSRLINHAGVGSPERALVSSLPTGSLPTDLGAVDTIIVQSPNLRALGGIPAVANPPAETGFGDPPASASTPPSASTSTRPTASPSTRPTSTPSPSTRSATRSASTPTSAQARSCPTRRSSPRSGTSSAFAPARGRALANAQRIMTHGRQQVYYDGAVASCRSRPATPRAKTATAIRPATGRTTLKTAASSSASWTRTSRAAGARS